MGCTSWESLACLLSGVRVGVSHGGVRCGLFGHGSRFWRRSMTGGRRKNGRAHGVRSMVGCVS